MKESRYIKNVSFMSFTSLPWRSHKKISGPDAPTAIKLILDLFSNLTASIRLTIASIGLNVKYNLD